MQSENFLSRKKALLSGHKELLLRPNQRATQSSPFAQPVCSRFGRPVLTRDHVPLDWRYDFNEETNPFLLERMGINSVFNAGALFHDGRYLVMARVEGTDRKSFFAIAESPNGVDQFEFWPEPILFDEWGEESANVYDARLTAHEDGYVYAVFCAERKDPNAPPFDTSAAIAQAGILRTKDLLHWERLPDLTTPSQQQRNVVLHPRFVRGHYLLYTRPQDGFIEAGSGGGIAWGLTKTMTEARLEAETLLDPRVYHTIKESKNGAGAPPLESAEGWIHIAHGVRQTAAGLRYVLYAFLTDLHEPWRVIAAPGGYLLAPEDSERLGDVSNVLFSNGVIQEPSGRVLIYYGSSDTRLHVAETSLQLLLDYLRGTPPDGRTSRGVVLQRLELIRKNRQILSGT
jgi:4-O-beta-D-mannosyl-D-glucose phosphorylase